MRRINSAALASAGVLARFAACTVFSLFLAGIWMSPALATYSHSSGSSSSQSVLDADYYCRVYGCVIVFDGSTYDIYDVYKFSNGGTVPAGGALISFYKRTIEIRKTGTLSTVTRPGSDESHIVGIDTNGDGVIDLTPGGGSNSGYLDLGDSLPQFPVTGQTKVLGIRDDAEHSFYVTSNIPFDVRARLADETYTGTLAGRIDPSHVSYSIGVTDKGKDGNMRFGTHAVQGVAQNVSLINDLGDLTATPQQVLIFAQKLWKKAASKLRKHVVRLDFTYAIRNYEMSMGAGSAEFCVEYSFYRRAVSPW